jgi:predicted double-glycine peptidase
MARRVPVVMQLSRVECGAACLAMVLGFHGRRTGVAECREACGAGRAGATADTLLQAARGFGLQAKGYALEPEACARVPLPAIVHWNFNHFVVLERWSPGRVDVVDPAAGRRRLQPAEFDAGFTGVLLAFQPGPIFQRRARSRSRVWSSYLARIWRVPGLKPLVADRDCPSPEHDPRRRRDRGPGQRPHRRARHARRSGAHRRSLPHPGPPPAPGRGRAGDTSLTAPVSPSTEKPRRAGSELNELGEHAAAPPLSDARAVADVI